MLAFVRHSAKITSRNKTEKRDESAFLDGEEDQSAASCVLLRDVSLRSKWIDFGYSVPLALALLAVVGFTLALSMAGCARVPDVPEKAAQTAGPGEPACIADVTAPDAARLVFRFSNTADGACSGQDWQGLFQFRYGHAGAGLSLDVLQGSPGSLRLEDGTAGLLYQDVSGASCWGWRGVLTWNDAPSWNVQIDAVCSDNPALAIHGTWNGNG